MITNDIIKETAMLCKLHIDDNEIAELTKEMQKIIDFADAINNVNADDMQEDNTVYDYALRDDEVQPSLDRREVLLNALENENGFFAVRGRM